MYLTLLFTPRTLYDRMIWVGNSLKRIKNNLYETETEILFKIEINCLIIILCGELVFSISILRGFKIIKMS